MRERVEMVYTDFLSKQEKTFAAGHAFCTLIGGHRSHQLMATWATPHRTFVSLLAAVLIELGIISSVSSSVLRVVFATFVA